MPRNVRNFWIEGSVDGYKNNIGMGPQSKDGGFYLTIKQRDNGCVTDPCSINGWIYDGVITLEIKMPDGKTIIHKTKR